MSRTPSSAQCPGLNTGHLNLGGMLVAVALLGACSSGAPRRVHVQATSTSLAVAPASPGIREPGPVTAPPAANRLQLPERSPHLPAGREDWIPLDPWVRASPSLSLEKLTASANPTYELSTPGGVFRFSLERRQARLNGMDLWLGFAPWAFQESVCLHRIDLQKNVFPFAHPAQAALITNRVIMLDPGHGGASPGTRSVLGTVFEKDYTLDWALRTARLLAKRGWDVRLTRTNDVELSLAERVQLADRVGAAAFLSLHFNSASSRFDDQGIETYCLTPVGLPSTLTRDFADDLEQEYPNNQFDEQNLRLASELHRALLSRTGAVDRGIRRARFMGVLRGQNRPAVLLEAGFLSHREEARRISQADYRELLAEAVVEALETYRAPLIAQWPQSTASPSDSRGGAIGRAGEARHARTSTSAP